MLGLWGRVDNHFLLSLTHLYLCLLPTGRDTQVPTNSSTFIQGVGSTLEASNGHQGTSNSHNIHFEITYRFKPIWKWSNTVVDANGNIKLSPFFLCKNCRAWTLYLALEKRTQTYCSIILYETIFQIFTYWSGNWIYNLAQAKRQQFSQKSTTLIIDVSWR